MSVYNMGNIIIKLHGVVLQYGTYACMLVFDCL